MPRGPLWGELQAGKSVSLDDGRVIAPDQVCEPAWKPRTVVVGGDNDKPELLLTALKNVDLLVHEATFTEDVLAKIGPQYMHSTAAHVARTAAAAQLPHLALPHFSQRYRDNELMNEAAQHYSGNLIMARDRDQYTLNKDGTLERHESDR